MVMEGLHSQLINREGYPELPECRLTLPLDTEKKSPVGGVKSEYQKAGELLELSPGLEMLFSTNGSRVSTFCLHSQTLLVPTRAG